jgi:hypothetical protein
MWQEGDSHMILIGLEEEDWLICNFGPMEARRFFRWEFQKFFISLSVLPGN